MFGGQGEGRGRDAILEAFGPASLRAWVVSEGPWDVLKGPGNFLEAVLKPLGAFFEPVWGPGGASFGLLGGWLELLGGFWGRRARDLRSIFSSKATHGALVGSSWGVLGALGAVLGRLEPP